jgi:hypothetical protein
MFFCHRYVLGCSIAFAMMTMTVPLAQAAEPSALSERELDLVTAGGPATERRSVARLARLVGYEVGAQRSGLVGFADRRRESAVGLLRPAIRAAREAAQSNESAGEGFCYPSLNSEPF